MTDRAGPTCKIRVVQCNSIRVTEVTGFFRRLGFSTTTHELTEPPANGRGKLVHVTLASDFDPFKLYRTH